MIEKEANVSADRIIGLRTSLEGNNSALAFALRQKTWVAPAIKITSLSWQAAAGTSISKPAPKAEEGREGHSPLALAVMLVAALYAAQAPS